MKTLLRNAAVASLLVFGAGACAELDVTNPNDADADRALSTPGDVLSLIGGSFNNWFYGNYSYFSGGLALSNAAFQHTAPWANAGMETYGRLPRTNFVNSVNDGNYNYLTRPWYYSYRAIAAANDGLRALETDEIKNGLTDDEYGSARAFGKFVQGIGHAQIALLFDEGFAVDETTDVEAPQESMSYDQLMDVAMDLFDEAIARSENASWTLNEDWMKAALTGPELAQVAHSMKARYRSMNARTWEERQALPWAEIIADVDAGIEETYIAFYDDDNGWSQDIVGYGQYFGWSQMPYFIYGMADQSGDFQAWDALPHSEKSYNIDGDPVLIVTPDNRFASGTTVEEQRANPGRYFHINTPTEEGSTWARPDRGTWRWSWYKHTRGEDYWFEFDYDEAEIRIEEMNLLKAEGLYHLGDLAGAAELINITREASGLNATDAAGTNTSCVPKLVDGSCGGLFEMLKWEKRMENTFRGPLGNLWFFDGRGWGDLWENTFLHLPIPCKEAQVLELPECNEYGGLTGEWGAPNSTYDWSHEGG